MTPIAVHVDRRDDRLTLRAAHRGRVATADAPVPDAERLGDLLRQHRGGHGATGRLGRMLGDVLYTDAVGDLIRAALHDAMREPTPLLLHTDDTTADWPWELAIDPTSGQRPALDGDGLARVSGPARAARRRTDQIPPRGLLAVPRRAGQPRLDALVATTRRLDRKTPLDILPADPVTGPGLRRALSSGAAVVHFEGVGADDRLHCDDGPVPAVRLGVTSACWLVVLGGSDVNTAAARRLREQGAAVVIARQTEQPVHQGAAFERALYRALADGMSPIAAVTTARRALAATDDDAWAAPVLYTAPGGPDAPALAAFPPPLTAAPINRAPLADGGAHRDAPAHPIPAPVFIQDTVRRMLAGDAPAARAAVVRALAGDLTLDAAAQTTDLSAAERTARLADRLIEAIGRPDGPLRRPDTLAEDAARLADTLALDPAEVTAAAHMLLASPALCLIGPDAARLARGLATLYAHCPVAIHAEAQGPLLAGPRATERGRTGGGWLYRTALLNWRRDPLDPLQPDQPQPRIRMPVVASRPGEQYIPCEGAWLVVEDAQRLDPGALTAATAAVERGETSGLNPDGRWYRLPIPAAFRLLLVATHPLPSLPATVPQLTVTGRPDRRRWLADATARLGAPTTEADEARRAQIADRLATVVDAVRLAHPIDHPLAGALLAHACALADASYSGTEGTPDAITKGTEGTPNGTDTITDAIDHATHALLTTPLAVLPHPRRAVLLAALAGDREATFRAIADAARAGDPAPAHALADALGRDDRPADPERLAAKIREWRLGAELALPHPDESRRLTHHVDG